MNAKEKRDLIETMGLTCINGSLHHVCIELSYEPVFDLSLCSNNPRAIMREIINQSENKGIRLGKQAKINEIKKALYLQK